MLTLSEFLRVTTETGSDDQPYIPPTKPYELSALATDLVLLARYLLKPGGRLVFFLPTVTEEYEEIDIQTMMCEGMEVIANSLQNFGSWGRRVCHLFFASFLPRPLISVIVDHNSQNDQVSLPTTEF